MLSISNPDLGASITFEQNMLDTIVIIPFSMNEEPALENIKVASGLFVTSRKTKTANRLRASQSRFKNPGAGTLTAVESTKMKST
jgi:hypothetical protein